MNKTLMEIMEEANYYSQANSNLDGKKGWSVIINRKIVNSNPSVITPEIAEKANAYIQPKESFTNIIDNYDENKAAYENDLNQIKMTNNMDYGRGMAV